MQGIHVVEVVACGREGIGVQRLDFGRNGKAGEIHAPGLLGIAPKKRLALFRVVGSENDMLGLHDKRCGQFAAKVREERARYCKLHEAYLRFAGTAHT